jgi:hypothetical protein
LQQGLTVSESKGRPISGKFEVDEGHFKLSIYTAQGAALQELVVDYTHRHDRESRTLERSGRFGGCQEASGGNGEGHHNVEGGRRQSGTRLRRIPRGQGCPNA